ncbi:phosphopantetheine-binding protein [Streptomyces sp. BE147]|uniref:acyl carrier protein n=1 Tax=unclassified Streptomyces TaxID=2593676 RepID=UPI002E7964A6|nr:phosphopantetheine-binding protein [Streptomyces sp. BE147]MEE1742630.1 phosphopantetheine-binding protein [Streptomyces sp. BE147]
MVPETDVETRVKKVLVDIFKGKFEAHEISVEADIVQDLGLDSLQAIEFLLRVEEEFDIELEYESLSLQTLRSVRQFSAETVQPLAGGEEGAEAREART